MHRRARRPVPSRDGPQTVDVAVAVWILVALLTAAAVLLVASAGAEKDGEVSGWAAFRRGLQARRRPDPVQEEAARAAAAEPVDVSLADFLRATVTEGDGYLQPEDLAEDLQRARERAAHVLRAPRRRVGARARARARSNG